MVFLDLGLLCLLEFSFIRDLGCLFLGRLDCGTKVETLWYTSFGSIQYNVKSEYLDFHLNTRNSVN